MRIGFTGTSRGMTDAQKRTVAEILVRWGATEVDHGDCVGADSDFHDIATALGLDIWIHPPENPKARAFRITTPERMLREKPYLARNKDIVNDTAMLIATPAGREPELRSGTWSTIRYSERTRGTHRIVFPDGTAVGNY